MICFFEISHKYINKLAGTLEMLRKMYGSGKRIHGN